MRQAIALVATLINVRLHEHLPHDASADAQRIWKFVRRRLLVCQWSMAAVFGVQVLRSTGGIPFHTPCAHTSCLCHASHVLPWLHPWPLRKPLLVLRRLE